MHQIIPLQTNPLPALVEDISVAHDYAKQSKSESTRKGYGADWKVFVAWCDSRNACPLPAAPEVVAGFLAAQAQAGKAVATIGRRVSAIAYAHRLPGYETPTSHQLVKETMHGIRNTLGAKPNRKAPLLAESVKSVANAAPDSVRGVRDKALMCLGFAMAARRSELAALTVEDLIFDDDGIRVRIAKGKTDQAQLGVTIGVVRGTGSSCPIRAIKEWLTTSGITSGPLFRSITKGGKIGTTALTPKSVNEITKAHGKRIGIDPTSVSSHSLRSGFLTSAAKKGASIFKMADISGHRSMDVLQSYVRDAEIFVNHAGAGLL
jgi:integrase